MVIFEKGATIFQKLSKIIYLQFIERIFFITDYIARVTRYVFAQRDQNCEKRQSERSETHR